jgi:hypothetical protein
MTPATGAALPGLVTVSRAGSTLNPLTVYLSIGGNAVSGTDYTALPATVTIPAGASSATLAVNPLPDFAAAGNATVTVSAVPNAGYALGGLNGAAIVLKAIPPSPFIIGSLNVTGTAGMPFNYQIAAANGPTGYSATGLPAGLAIDPVAGIISGTAMTPGSATAIITATNALGASSAALNIAILGSFGAWRQQSFAGADLADPTMSGDTAAPAGDGIPNLMKYALDLPPELPGIGGLPVSSTTSSYNNTYLTLTYTYSASAPDVTYVVEVSNDMQNWHSGDGYTLTLSTAANPGGLTNTCTVEDVNPLGATPQFMRLRVIGP